MKVRITIAAFVVLAGALPVEAGVAKRMVQAAGRVAGKAVAHSVEAEKVAETANAPTQAGAANAPSPPRRVAGVTAITTPAGQTAAPAAKSAAPAPAAKNVAAAPARAGKAAAATPAAGTSTAMTVDAFGDSVTALPPTLRENNYFYSSFGTQDPFRSLLAGDFQPKLQDLVDVHTVELVGVIWEPDEIAAMVQDAQGFGYTLRPGDRVKNGTVVAVRRDALVARLNIFGQTTQVTLRLQRDEE